MPVSPGLPLRAELQVAGWLGLGTCSCQVGAWSPPYSSPGQEGVNGGLTYGVKDETSQQGPRRAALGHSWARFPAFL